MSRKAAWSESPEQGNMASRMARRPVSLTSLRGRLARRLLGEPNLVHNGVPVAEYGDDLWYLAATPAWKGAPFDADNLVTVNGHDFLRDEPFITAIRAAEARWEPPPRDISWRLHIGLASVGMALATHVEGDFVELGTGRGYMAAGICSMYSSSLSHRELKLVDRFRPPSLDVSRNAPPADLPFSYAEGASEVRDYFRSFEFVSIIQTDLPDGIRAIGSSSICWLHVDLNDPVVEVATLMALRGLLRPGAIVLFDDTGNPGRSESADRHVELMRAWGAPMAMLPTGQAVAVIPVTQRSQ